MNKTILEMNNIVKEFPGVRALDGVNLNIRKGEFHSLVGENGAGKSTLMKILSGVYTDYEGEIYLCGQKTVFSGIRNAEKAGIAIIHQELNLIYELSVMENIYLGSFPCKLRHLIDYPKMELNTKELLSRFELDISPWEPIRNLSIGKQQMVEIVKAISKKADILIFDEPTSALTEQEAESLFKIIESLRKKGVTIIYISHRMEEIFRFSDRITILRDGSTVGTWERKNLDHDTLVKHMVGREIADIYPRIENHPAETVLRVENYYVHHPLRPGERVVDGVNFELKKGEILGIAGLMGAGRSELAESLFGAFPAESGGEVYLSGKKIHINSPHEAIKKGFGLVTEDRKRFGLITGLSVGKNMTLSVIHKIRKFFLINEKDEENIVEKYIKSLRIKTPSTQFIVNNLSGGNQQKVILGKWLATEPKILILDEPTRGIDIGAKSEIYNIIKDLSERGVSIIMISSELPEVLRLSNRILIMHKGHLQAIIPGEGATQEKIMHYATGGN
ncbi:MAG: sugar ABC transporter ATP-binding protein [Candidatus Saganbacteria bacterium]|nr:sugar ABC transporter ATP-binding protein [Candidatus Saganbacteria bacterium]